MADETVETIDLTPTWEGILPAYIEMIAREAAVMAADPETLRQRRANRATAEAELRKMARLADAYVEHRKMDPYPPEPNCPECGEPLTVEGAGDGTGDPQHVFCDICGKAEHPADLTPDWNGETGNHISCERPLVRK